MPRTSGNIAYRSPIKINNTFAEKLMKVAEREDANEKHLRGVAYLFDPPTHPGNRCSGEQGGVAVAASDRGAGSGERGLQGTRAAASVREQAQSALIRG